MSSVHTTHCKSSYSHRTELCIAPKAPVAASRHDADTLTRDVLGTANLITSGASSQIYYSCNPRTSPIPCLQPFPPLHGKMSVVIQLQAHTIINLVVCKGDVVFVDVVPLLNPDFVRPGARLCCYQLLQIPDRVFLTANPTQSIRNRSKDSLVCYCSHTWAEVS